MHFKHLLKLSCFMFLLLLFALPALAQNVVVTGKVTDSKDGSTMPGVSIAVKGTTSGTVTDANGNFKLTVSGSANILVITYIGYKRQEIETKDNTVLNIKLEPNQNALNEVVVIGYGTQTKRNSTGAVSTIKAADLNTTNAVSIDNLIQGKAAGVNVSVNTSQPGGSVNVTIRGSLSPNGSNNPLYVIDGLPLTSALNESVPTPGAFRGNVSRSPLAGLSPDDIESVDILKDASATAIYGSAAANGVVLITTKKGKSGAAMVSYSGTYSVQSLKKYLQPLDATQFENGVNAYGEESYKVLNKITPYGSNTSGNVPFKPFFSAAEVAAAGKGTNYIEYILRNGSINDQNISVSGGNENTKIYTSFNYFDQQGAIRNSGFTRYAGRINLDQKIGKRVNLTLNISYSQVNNDNVPVGQSGDTDSPSLLQTALQFPSSIAPFDAQGQVNGAYYDRTPSVAGYFRIINQTFTKRMLITPNLQVNISDALKLNITGGIDNNTSDGQFFVPVGAFPKTLPIGYANRSFTKLNNYSTEAYLSYDKRFNKSHFSVVAGVGYYESNNTYFGLDAQGFSTNVFGVNNVGIAYQKESGSVNSGKTARAKLSQFTRINYTYDDKYIVQLIGRADGSSNFPPDHLFGFFPGISGGWVMNREDFLKDVKWLSQLKLRGGYGTTGNESITAGNNYVYPLYNLSNSFQYIIGPQLYNTGFYQTQAGNPQLKWETDEQINIGFDFGLFNNRITGSLDYFRRTAKDLLDFRSLPAANAFITGAANIGSTRSTGFELAVTTQNIVKPSFSWSTTFTIGTAKSYWVERNPAVALAPYLGYNDPIHEVYGWKTNGLIRKASDIPSYQPGAFVGNIKYVDVNNDGKLDINDVQPLGNTDPSATFGLNNTLTYRNFDLNFFFYGSLGSYSYDGYWQFANAGILARQSTPGNSDIHTLDVWATFNPNGKYPGFAPDVASANNPSTANNYLTVKNGFFVRLKNIDLGYSLPAALIAKQKVVRSIRFFIDVQNLFYISNITGIDPEMSRDNNPYPVVRTTAFGISAKF